MSHLVLPLHVFTLRWVDSAIQYNTLATTTAGTVVVDFLFASNRAGSVYSYYCSLPGTLPRCSTSRGTAVRTAVVVLTDRKKRKGIISVVRMNVVGFF